nr:hypothetical protein [uncultured Bacteroides sp.]
MNKRKVRNIPLGECWWCKRITNMDEIKKTMVQPAERSNGYSVL